MTIDNQAATPPVLGAVAGEKRGDHPLKKFWRRIRKPLAQSRFAKAALVNILAAGLRFLRLTSPMVRQTADWDREYAAHEPGIIALWHGQHLITAAFYPGKRKLMAMVSRSADAELNAEVLEKFGIETVRGSGGRDSAHKLDKGGAKALIALKKSLAAGNNAAMIADIPHGTPRDSGMGIVVLAKISGRPILPCAMATSRRKVLEKSWDKTVINLPFSRSILRVGPPIYVSAKADDAEMEAKRLEVTAALDAVTAEAYSYVDNPQ